MKLKSLSVRNFKPFDDTGITIAPGRITVLIGANGSGKSSLLQAMLALKQSTQTTTNLLNLNGSLIRLGAFRDVVHGQEAGLDIGIAVSYMYHYALPDECQSVLPPSGIFDYTLTSNPNSGEHKAVLRHDAKTWIEAKAGPSKSFVNPSTLVFPGIAKLNLTVSPFVGQPIMAQLAEPLDPERAGTVTTDLNNVLATIQTNLQEYFLVPAMRGFDQLAYSVMQGGLAEDLTVADSPEQLASLIANTIGARSELLDEVSDRISAIFGTERRQLRTRVRNARISGEISRARSSINLFNEAFGLNQLVALLLWIAKAPRGAVIGVEEPEIHLHPRAQAALCDVLIDAALAEDKQLILTTHSEHILMGLLGSVARGRIPPEDLAVYEFESADGVAHCERLEVNPYGQVQGGLRAFMEVDLDQIDQLISTRLRGGRA